MPPHRGEGQSPKGLRVGLRLWHAAKDDACAECDGEHQDPWRDLLPAVLSKVEQVLCEFKHGMTSGRLWGLHC
jgi:hypothetical protein